MINEAFAKEEGRQATVWGVKVIASHFRNMKACIGVWGPKPAVRLLPTEQLNREKKIAKLNFSQGLHQT